MIIRTLLMRIMLCRLSLESRLSKENIKLTTIYFACPIIHGPIAIWFTDPAVYVSIYCPPYAICHSHHLTCLYSNALWLAYRETMPVFVTSVFATIADVTMTAEQRRCHTRAPAFKRRPGTRAWSPRGSGRQLAWPREWRERMANNQVLRASIDVFA